MRVRRRSFIRYRYSFTFSGASIRSVFRVNRAGIFLASLRYLPGK
jgi:hypothetical protein